MPQGWDFPKGSIYGSFITDFNKNKVRPALRPSESQLTYFAYLDCERFRAGLCLSLHLLLSTTAAQADVGNMCAYHGIWIIWIWQGHSHMAARGLQVTFLASPHTNNCRSRVGAKFSWRGGRPGTSCQYSIMDISCKVYCRSINECYIALALNNGCIVVL